MKKFFYICQTVSKFTHDIEIKMYKKVLLYPSNSFEVYPLFFSTDYVYLSVFVNMLSCNRIARCSRTSLQVKQS